MNKPCHILFSEEQIKAKVHELAGKVAAMYAPDEDIYAIAIAFGAVFFLADLIREIPNQVFPSVVRIHSYDSDHRGTLSMDDTLSMDPAGKQILILDDLLDSGTTLLFLKKYLLERGAASVKTCVLLDKKSGHAPEIRADLYGFDCPPHFIFGYGMDDAEGRFRNLPYIACD